MFSVNTLRGPALQKRILHTLFFFSFVWSNSAGNSIFFRARPKYFLLKNTIGHQETELCYIQYPTFVDLPGSVDDFIQICFTLKYFSWSWCPTVGSNKDQPAGQQDVVGLGHLEDPHLGGQQHHLLPGVGWEIFQCCLWAPKTKLSISFVWSIDWWA